MTQDESFVGCRRLISGHHAAAMPSAREPPSPVAIHPLVAQAVDDLVAAVDRTHCGVVVHGCALTLTAVASMIGDGALQMYEQIDIDGGVVFALGDAITLLPGGNPIMFFGSFVKDDNVFIAGIVPGHEANVSFEPLHAPAQLARLTEADAAKVVGKVDKAKAGTAISKLKQQGFVSKKIARLTPPPAREQPRQAGAEDDRSSSHLIAAAGGRRVGERAGWRQVDCAEVFEGVWSG